jgi:hypothetical protein
MKPNMCSVSIPSAWAQAGSSTARDTTAAWKVFARIDIRIQRVIGLRGRIRRWSRTYPSMTQGSAASHGEGWSWEKLEADRKACGPTAFRPPPRAIPRSVGQDPHLQQSRGNSPEILQLGAKQLARPTATAVAGAGQTVSTRFYLRAAQAYMLISMPTGTSTIFGVFQLIRVLPSSVGTTSCRHRN